MHKFLHDRYKDVSLTSKQVPMIADILRTAININTSDGKNVLPEVLKIIAEKTDIPERPAHGITKAEIQSRIKTLSNNKGGNGYELTASPLSRKICDDCINVLIGASLIYTDKRIHCTSRGLYITHHLITEGDISGMDTTQNEGGNARLHR